MARVFLGLGSNVGDRIGTIKAAAVYLSALLDGMRMSSLYGSKPLYLEEQPDFVNAVVTGDTQLEPLGLLAAVNHIESRFGRDRGREVFKGPRTLDIDILLYGPLVLHDRELTLPHPGLKERRFALEPMLELDPAALDPENGLPYAHILRNLPSQGIYLLE